jgi:hypothetical protein
MKLLSRRLLRPRHTVQKPEETVSAAAKIAQTKEQGVDTKEHARNVRQFGVQVLTPVVSDTDPDSQVIDRVGADTIETREASALFGWGRKKKDDPMPQVDEKQAASVRTIGSELVSEPEEIDEDFVPEPPVPEEERVVENDSRSRVRENGLERATPEKREATLAADSEDAGGGVLPSQLFFEGVSDPVPLEDDESEEGEVASDSEGSTDAEKVAEPTPSEQDEPATQPEPERARLDQMQSAGSDASEDAVSGEDETEDDMDDDTEDGPDEETSAGVIGDGDPTGTDSTEADSCGTDDEELGRRDMTARDTGPVAEQTGPETDLSEQAQGAIMAIEGSEAHTLSASHGLPVRRRHSRKRSMRAVSRPADGAESSPIDVDSLAQTTVDMDWPDRRQSLRLRMSRLAGFVRLPQPLEDDVYLSDLPWRASATINFSAGGAMMECDEEFATGDLVMIHVDMGDLFFPPFAVARVSHVQKTENGRYCTGLMFITDEDKQELLPAETVTRLPGEVFEYGTSRSRQIETTIAAWKRQSLSLVSQEESK